MQSIDGIIHSPPGTDVDGSPAEYPNVRALVRAGVGFDGLNLEAWGRNGTAVFNVPDYGTSEVADHAIALMLALTRGVITYHDAIRADPATGWTQGIAPAVRRLRDAVFGVVGLGRIGLAAATRARAFGMRIAFHDPYLPSGMEIAVGAQRCASLHELMAISDVVSVHAPANEETRGLIGAASVGACQARSRPDQHGARLDRRSRRASRCPEDAADHGRGAGRPADEPADPTHPLIAAWRAVRTGSNGRLASRPHAAFYSPASVIDMRVKSVETVLRHLRTRRSLQLRQQGVSGAPPGVIREGSTGSGTIPGVPAGASEIGEP